MNEPFKHFVAIRWRDSDALGHINHAVFLTYLEEGRDAFLASVMGPNPMYVVARIEIDLKRELRLDRREVAVTVAVERVGRTSIVLHEEILDAGGATAADARTTIVAWEPTERRPVPIDEALRGRLLASQVGRE